MGHYSILKILLGNINILRFCASKKGRLTQSYLGRGRQEPRRQREEALGAWGLALASFPESYNSRFLSFPSPYATPQALNLSFELLLG